MQIILLAIIAGLIGTDIYFKHAVRKDGTSSSFSELLTLLGLILIIGGLFYAMASGFNSWLG
ncbi:MAG: hypothetical protein NUV47_02645 [Patescibacteria group bacterium]|nr:hypothetical protein [Patescibacteria group bacterium]